MGLAGCLLTSPSPPIERIPLMASITPFLMFKGDASQAISLYSEAFSDTEILSLETYSTGGLGKEGSVKRASLRVLGQNFTVIDSAVEHEFDFTPSISLFVECDSLEMLQASYQKLSNQGEVLMPLNNYGFSKQFAWVTDRFGVSWQLNLSD
jgi:predicted 3-demethylubiquinone-9 3-methyltransferase (glyoxalase superfamily)